MYIWPLQHADTPVVFVSNSPQWWSRFLSLCELGGGSWGWSLGTSRPSPSGHSRSDRTTDWHMGVRQEEVIMGQWQKAFSLVDPHFRLPGWPAPSGEVIGREEWEGLGRLGLLQFTPPRPVGQMNRRAATNDQTGRFTNILSLLHFSLFLGDWFPLC